VWAWMISHCRGEFTLINGIFIEAGDISGIWRRCDAAHRYPDVVLNMVLRQRDKIVQHFLSRTFVLLGPHVTGDRVLPDILGRQCGIV